MLNSSEKMLTDFYNRFVGTVRPVLVEHTSRGGIMHGFTDNYIKVAIPADRSLANRVVNVRLTENLGEEVKGEVVR